MRSIFGDLLAPTGGFSGRRTKFVRNAVRHLKNSAELGRRGRNYLKAFGSVVAGSVFSGYRGSKVSMPAFRGTHTHFPSRSHPYAAVTRAHRHSIRSRYRITPRKSYRGSKRRTIRRKSVTRRRRGKRSVRRKGKRGTKGGLMGHLYKMICTPRLYKNTFGFTSPGTANQRTWYWDPLFTNYDLQAFNGEGAPDRYITSTTEGAASTATSYGVKTGKLRVKRAVKFYRLQNRSNADMELTMYICKPRRSCDVSAIDVASTWATQAFQHDDATTNAQGPGQLANPTGVTQKWQYPAYTPYMSPSFTSVLQVAFTKKVTLGPGETIKKTFKMKGGSFPIERILNGDCTWWKGHSYGVLWSWVGGMVDDGNADGVVGKANCLLQWEYDYHAEFDYLPRVGALYDIGAANNEIGFTTGYKINPAAFVARVPASQIVETITSGITTGDQCIEISGM